MSNIFGKAPTDYKYLNVIKDHQPESYGQQLNLLGGRDMGNTKQIMDNAVNNNANILGYLTNNFTAFQAEIQEEMFLSEQVTKYIPVKNGIPEGATSYTYRKEITKGEAGYIDSEGTNAKGVSVSYEVMASRIHQAGNTARWTLQDVRTSLAGGVSLEASYLRTAVRACNEHIIRAALFGSKLHGFTGILNNEMIATSPDYSIHEATPNTIEEKDKEEGGALKYLNGILSDMVNVSNTVLATADNGSLTIYLPPTQYTYLATTDYKPFTDKSIMQRLKDSNPWTSFSGKLLKFEPSVHLLGAGTLLDGKVADRMLISMNDPKILEFAVPISPRLIRLVDMGRYVEAPLEYSTGQPEIMHPAGVRYVDGV